MRIFTMSNVGQYSTAFDNIILTVNQKETRDLFRQRDDQRADGQGERGD